DAALKAVNELFNNNTPSTDAIKGTTDQAAINAAKALVDAVTDPTVKAALQKDLNRAQELLDASNVLAKPQLNPMTEADTVFSGKLDIAKYNPGTIRIYINNTPATVVAVDASGNFSYNIGNRKAGDTISVDYKDRTGQYNAATKTSITVTPVSSNVTINKMTENDDTITGKTAPNAKVRYVVGGQPVNVGYADVNGNYTMYIGKQKVGTVVGVEVFDPATNKYKAAVTTTVLAVNVTIQAMTNATDTVSGTAPANAKLRFLIGGVAVNVGTADANGNYSKYVGTQIVGTEVAVEMLNPETGKYELAKKIQVTGAPKSTTYTVNALTTEDDTLKGTAPANAKLRFSINGNLISVITADASGNYSKYIGKQKAGVDVSVELLNENTNQYTAPQSVTVTTGTGNATLAPVINTITEGQGVVTGTVPTSISQVRVWVNGTAQTMVAVTNGNFTWTKANLKVDDKVKVDYKDATGTWISAEKIVTN
ncbi:Ig-like domain-containing protein, partial [Listeria booriae]